MKKAKKLLSFLLITAVIMAASTGCSSTKSNDTKAEPTDVPVSSTNTEAAANDEGIANLIPTEPTEVVLWHSVSGANETILQEIVDEYNAGPGTEKGITVTSIYQGSYEEFSTKLSATLQAGDTENLPDLVQLSSKGIFDVKDSKYLYPIQNLLDMDPEGIDASTFNEASAAYCTYNGNLLGVPFSTSSIMMYYNKDHFVEAGLDPDAPPTTIKGLAEAVDKLTVRNGDKIERYGLGTKLRFFILGTWIPSAGESYAMFNNDNGRTGTPTEISMTKDGSLEKVLTEWSAVLNTKGVEYTDAQPNESFVSGYYSIMFASSSSLTSVIGQTEGAGTMNLGVSEIVRVDDNSSLATGIGGSAFYMFDRDNQNNILATWDFIKYLATPEVSSKWFIGTGYYPMNMDALETDEVKALLEEHPQYNIINTILEHSAGFTDYTEPWIPSFSDTDTYLQDEIIKFSEGSQDIGTTISNIDAGATQKLEDYISANQ